MHQAGNTQKSNEKMFNGEIVVSDHKKAVAASASAIIKSNKISISFVLDNELIAFTAVKNEADEFVVNEKVLDDFILTGASRGSKKNRLSQVVLGQNSDTLEFHIIIDFFTGESKEITFRGGFGKAVKKKVRRNLFMRTVAALAA